MLTDNDLPALLVAWYTDTKTIVRMQICSFWIIFLEFITF